ncbi:hypothetical protein [Phaeodactylibacter luteus]|nr:hypothetical protein [Phaeodactylibacter luteus]
MAKSRKQQRIEARQQQEGKRILNIFLIATAVLLLLMYLVFQFSS